MFSLTFFAAPCSCLKLAVPTMIHFNVFSFIASTMSLRCSRLSQSRWHSERKWGYSRHSLQFVLNRKKKAASFILYKTKGLERQLEKKKKKNLHGGERQRERQQRLSDGASSFNPVARESIRRSPFLTTQSLSKQGPCFAASIKSPPCT